MSPKNQIDDYRKAVAEGKRYLRKQRLQQEKMILEETKKPHTLLSPPLKSLARMSELLSQNYLEGSYVNGIKKVAWFSSGAPTEILQSLGFFLYTPDNHAALCGSRRVAVEYCEAAENVGYSRDICSYARTDIGAFLLNKTPVGKIPKPDLIVVCNNICQTILHWYQAMGVYYDAPVFLIDTPFLYEDAQDHQVEFVKNQLEELAEVAERISGNTFSMKKMTAIGDIGMEAAAVWLEILNKAKHRPAPITTFDAFILMGPIVAMRGQKVTLDFYRDVLKEVDERVKNGVAAVITEKYRVLWDNLPIWYRIKWTAETLASHGIAAVVSNYTLSWADSAQKLDPNRPIESCARTYLKSLLNRSAGYKLNDMKRLIKEFDLDGVLFHSDRSCKPYSLGQEDQRAILFDELHVPGLIMEADHNDARVFSEEQVANGINAFAEMMG